MSGSDIRVLSPRPLCDVKLQTRALLKITDHAKEILGLRITAWTEHPDKTLGLGPGRFTKLFKSDGCLDIVAQDRLAGFDIPAQHRIDAFAKKRFGKLLVVLGAGLHQFLEASCLRHLSQPAIWIGPRIERILNAAFYDRFFLTQRTPLAQSAWRLRYHPCHSSPIRLVEKITPVTQR